MNAIEHAQFAVIEALDTQAEPVEAEATQAS